VFFLPDLKAKKKFNTMMKAVILTSLLASAAAFAPSQQTRGSTCLNEFARGYVGGEGPEPMFIGATGSKNFDPAGLCDVRYIGWKYRKDYQIRCMLSVHILTQFFF
jgi:hypothetical protein